MPEPTSASGTIPPVQPGAVIPGGDPTPAAAVTPPVSTPIVTPPPAGDLDLSKLDEATRNYILSLRKEAGGYRTKAKEANDLLKGVKTSLGLDDQASPEEKIKSLNAQTTNLAHENAVLANALEHGVQKDGLDYFSYLVTREAGLLKDGEELQATKIAELAAEAKAKAVKPGASTSVVPAAGGQTPPPANGNTMTVEGFVALSITQRSTLFNTHPEVYSELFSQAVKKGLIK